ncbi:MAG: hypothetical protein HOE80_05025 [Candidatus Magasanikbacteria bacterium]|jgi:hypothetical protein|nr:hypothetical protein [Candidatus Magasanikbacteria bacterium]MBT4072051.1 hypothetical protein [Candidatus Magasanikbacteria bacterium]
MPKEKKTIINTPAISSKKQETKTVLVEQQMLDKIYEQNEIIKKRLRLMVIANYLRIVFLYLPILIGLVISFVYLPSFLEQIFGQYAEVLGIGLPGGGVSAQLLEQIPQILEQLQK